MLQAIVQPLVLQAASVSTNKAAPAAQQIAKPASMVSFSEVGIAPQLSLSTNRLLFNNVIGTAVASSPMGTVKLTNSGTADLTINALTLGGADGALYTLVSPNPGTVAPGASVNISVRFTPPADTTPGLKIATLQIDSNDPATPAVVDLRALATVGTGGANEPSLQRIMDLYQIPNNVGDSNPDDTFIDMPAALPNDELPIQRLRRAASGPVTITPLAVFGLKVSPVLRFGYYQPGYTSGKTELLTVPNADFQSVNPRLLGATRFDPGTAPFSLYTTFPGFKNSDGQTRVAYSEDHLNYWEANPVAKHKIRFWPMKDQSGAVVANAYVFAVEDFNDGYESNDFVGIITNVKRSARIGSPAMGLSAGNGLLFNDRLLFHKAQYDNPDFVNPSYHDTETLTIRNTGAVPLNISSIGMTGATNAFTITSISVNGAAATAYAPGPISVEAGGNVALTVKFIATTGSTGSGKRYETFLAINSNDPTAPKQVVQLEGQWQSYPNSTPAPGSTYTEPTAMQLSSLFGYSTQIVYAGQSLNTGGLKSAIGEEILTEYWARADSTQPVSVRQLVAFHTGNEISTIRWFNKGSGSLSTLFSHRGSDAQTILPRLNNSTAPAQGAFSPSGSFGLKIDNEYSVDSMNTQSQPGGNYGHDIRFYPARDRAGRYIANTYLVFMDFYGRNYDYQDNVYLMQNLKPSLIPGAPTGLAASGTNADGVLLQWAANPEASVSGYNVYRSTTAAGSGFSLVNASPITTATFLDAEAPVGGPYYYRVTAINSAGESFPAQASTLRPQQWYVGSDVGSPSTTGGTTRVGANDFDLYGGGSEIGGWHDRFHYSYGWQYGDFDVQVRITSLDNTNSAARAGLMARVSLNDGSRNLFAGVSPTTFVGSTRGGEGGNTTVKTVTDAGAMTFPNAWSRIVRTGSTMTGYLSTDGINWTQANSITDTTLPDVLYLGMAVTSHSATAGANASFRDLASQP